MYFEQPTASTCGMYLRTMAAAPVAPPAPSTGKRAAISSDEHTGSTTNSTLLTVDSPPSASSAAFTETADAILEKSRRTW